MNTYTKSFLVIFLCLFMLAAVNRMEAYDDLLKTNITSHMEAPIQSGRNVVFCATFSIAWNRLKDEIIKEEIKVKTPVEIVPYLNKSLITESDMTAADYLAMAGLVENNIVGKINQGLQRKFGFDAWLLDPHEYKDPATILAYAFLNKNMRFKNPFEDFKEPLYFVSENKRDEVAGFGVHQYLSQPEHSQMGDQVEILEYIDKGNFIIRLKAESSEDEIVLAKVAPDATLLNTYEKINSRIADSQPISLQKNDVLQIPKFDLALIQSYSTLLDVHLANKGFEDYFFAEAAQRINFKLDESGARVKSEGKIVLKKGGPIDFKLLLFDSPFLLYLKKPDGRYPYLMMWIDNTGLLVKSK